MSEETATMLVGIIFDPTTSGVWISDRSGGVYPPLNNKIKNQNCGFNCTIKEFFAVNVCTECITKLLCNSDS